MPPPTLLLPDQPPDAVQLVGLPLVVQVSVDDSPSWIDVRLAVSVTVGAVPPDTVTVAESLSLPALFEQVIV